MEKKATVIKENTALDELFVKLNNKSALMNIAPINSNINKAKDAQTIVIEREINIENLSLVHSKLKTYFSDIWETKGWNVKFSHGDINMLFNTDEDGNILLPENNGKELFDEILKGSMYIKGTTKVSGLFIMKSITESKVALALKLFVVGMFPNIQIVDSNSDGSMAFAKNGVVIPFQLILLNVVFLCMYGRAKFDAYAKKNFYLPYMYDSEVINQFMTATGLHKA